MRLKIKILDYKNLEDSQWILCKSNLNEYLESLKPSFYEYIIQRKIVKNKYLSSLIDTVIGGEPVPMITLTLTDILQGINTGDIVTIEMEKIEILDGLQRTFRLWAYYKIIQEFDKHSGLTPIEFAKEVKNQYPEFFDSGIITLTKIKEHFSISQFKILETAFQRFDIYFILWGGLNSKRIIHKMLVLNAGQRPVSLTHQYELLFLFVWEEVKKTSGIKLFRERDPQATKIKAGDRKAGEYMFSSVIAGLRSYLENKPKRISIDDLDIEDLQQGESAMQINENVFTKPYIEKFLNKLKDIDEAIILKEKEEGRKWFVRDTTLSGMLAGLGKYVGIKETMTMEEIDILTEKGFDNLEKVINQIGFSLPQFQDEYYNLQSRTINVGTYVRVIIMEYTYNLLNNSPASWKTLFAQSKSTSK